MLHQEENERLMKALDFTALDVSLNREGILSERQRTLLNQTRFPSNLKVGGVIIAFAFLGVALGFIYAWLNYGPFSLERIRNDSTIAISLIWGAGGFGLIGVWLAMQSLLTRRNIQRGKVSIVSGKAQLRTKLTNGKVHHQLFIGRTKFYLDEQMYIAFSDGYPYHVYFIKTPISNIILSAEWLRDEG